MFELMILIHSTDLIKFSLKLMDLESVLQLSNRYHHEGEDVALLHHWWRIGSLLKAAPPPLLLCRSAVTNRKRAQKVSFDVSTKQKLSHLQTTRNKIHLLSWATWVSQFSDFASWCGARLAVFNAFDTKIGGNCGSRQENAGVWR